MRSIQFFISASLFSLLFTCGQSYAQSNAAHSYYIVMEDHTPSFLNHLFKKYGVEHSEKILMNVQAFENEQHVTVLYKDEYYQRLSQINQAISACEGTEKAERLKERKNSMVLFSTIEDEVND
ncbi:MAG: hypothetical protein EP338_01110 [Bacteroidetes bacterium]|nr:MAG: hypothetical protein EP338_01110 [Bacteroidota bacterium]